MRHISGRSKYKDFPGLFSNVDRYDRAPGSTVVQDNMTCVTAGMLKCRKGARNVVFGSDDVYLAFDGSASGAFDTTSNFRAADSNGTVILDFKSSASGANVILFESSDEASDTKYTIMYLDASGDLVVGQRSTGNTDGVQTTGTSWNNNKWHRVAFVADTSAYRIIVDGVVQPLSVVVGSNAGRWFDQTSTERDNITVAFTRNLSGDSAFFTGGIRRLLVYSAALSNATLLADWEGTLSTTSLVNRWDMDEGTGSRLFDSVGSNDMEVLDTTPPWTNSLTADRYVTGLHYVPRPSAPHLVVITSDGSVKLKYSPS